MASQVSNRPSVAPDSIGVSGPSDLAAEVAAPVGDRPRAGGLLEKEAIRFAEALDDYDHVSVTAIGGTEDSGYWLSFTDERFGLSYEIDSHADYWDFVTALVRSVRRQPTPGARRLAVQWPCLDPSLNPRGDVIVSSVL